MTARRSLPLAIAAATLTLSACGTFTDNDVVAGVNEAELTNDDLRDLAGDLDELPAQEALVVSGKIQFPNGPGWTTEWVRNWRSTKDKIEWEVDVKAAGTYVVSMTYACAEKNIGSRFQVAIARSVASCTERSSGLQR